MDTAALVTLSTALGLAFCLIAWGMHIQREALTVIHQLVRDLSTESRAERAELLERIQRPERPPIQSVPPRHTSDDPPKTPEEAVNYARIGRVVAPVEAS